MSAIRECRDCGAQIHLREFEEWVDEVGEPFVLEPDDLRWSDNPGDFEGAYRRVERRWVPVGLADEFTEAELSCPRRPSHQDHRPGREVETEEVEAA